MSFKFLSIFLTALALISCSPKDAPLDGAGTDFGSFSEDIEVVNEVGGKLSTCSGEKDQTWSSIRFFHEFKGSLLSKATNNQISIVVAKGDRNCLKVGDRVEFQFQEDPNDNQSYEGIGSFVYVEKLEMMDTGFLLSNTRMMAKFSAGMGLTPARLSSFLRDRPRDQVTVAFLSKEPIEGGATNPFEDFGDEIEEVTSKDQKLSTCSGDEQPTWSTIRLFNEFRDLIGDKLGTAEITAIVSKGDFNCVKVGSKVEFELQNEEGSGFEKTGSFVYVQKILRMDTGYLLSESDRLMEYAKAMGLTVSQLSDYIRDRPRDQVTVTFVSLEESPVDDGGVSDDPVVDDDPVVSGPSFTILKNAGEKTESCGDQTWLGLRLQTWFVDEHKTKMIENFNNKTMKVFVGAGDKQCLPLGAQGQYEALNADDNFELMGDKFTVQSIVVRPKADLLDDPILLEYLAQDMGLTTEMFKAHIENMRNDFVNMIFMTWEEEQ
ncbi:MAG: hypothetical protein HRT44_05385 [Bdellovibrionales bacterium]|nr:hypothetical protein [Bdellovibrionales bacterium]NQZ18675.1 hypothetical protein [Bdellovibrionales bacterium]